MADSGDSDSDTDIHVYKPQKSNVSFIKIIGIHNFVFNYIIIFRLSKVMKKAHPVVLMANLINVQYVSLD
jgi:hypothetical protein